MGKQQGYVEVEFNGENKLLRFDFNAVADIEEYFGVGIAAIMSDQRVGFSTIRALYWGGLKWKMKGLTINQAGAMIQKKIEDDGTSFKDLMKPVADGLKAAGIFGNKKDKQENDDEQDEEGESPN